MVIYSIITANFYCGIFSMLDGKGYQSRIPVADFWNVEFYKYFKTK